MTVKIPTRWATNTTYAAGPDSPAGLTKIDPASSADGFVRGTLAAPQFINYLIDPLAACARRAMAIALCKPRKLDITLDDTSGIIAVVSQGAGKPAVIGTFHSGGVPWVNDCEPIFEAGVVTSITSNAQAGSRNPTTGRILIGGVGGNRCCYSDDAGVTWTAGANVGATVSRILWNPVHSRFIAQNSSGMAYSSTGAAAWTNVASGTSGAGGLSLLPNGNMISGDSLVSFNISTDGGTTWGNTAGTVPNAGDISLATFDGTIGVGYDYVYHGAIRAAGDGKLQVCRTSDGSSWTVIAEISPPGSDAFVDLVDMSQCPDTGVLFAIVRMTDTNVIYASIDGSVWTEAFLAGSGTAFPFKSNGSGAANGRLFLADQAGGLYATDGIGRE